MVSLEDEAQKIVDRGDGSAAQQAQESWQNSTQPTDDEHARERVLDEQRLQRQTELVAILRKNKVATVPIYKGEGLFAAKVDGWIISGYRPGGNSGRGQIGEMTVPELEIFGVALCSDGICYAFRREGKPRWRGGYGYGRRIMMGPTRPLRRRIQQEIAVSAKCGTFATYEWDGDTKRQSK